MLWNGLNLEQWFERFLANLGDVPSAVVTEGVEPMSIVEGPYTGKPNPHAWMSPERRADLRREHPRGAERGRPGNAEVYAANAAAYAEEIRAFAEPMRERLAAIPEERRWLVSSEGAFSYLARDFGLNELYIWPINADQQGTPQQVRRVIDAVREHDDPGGLLREHRARRRRRADRARDRRGLRRRALRRQPVASRTGRCRPTSTCCG